MTHKDEYLDRDTGAGDDTGMGKDTGMSDDSKKERRHDKDEGQIGGDIDIETENDLDTI